ncbi:MAG: tetratricopeptide repeat protein [Gammaproteobacteria bacterium]
MYTRAAKQGVAEAQYSLGTMYEQGKGAEKNSKEAIEWYRKAAEQNYVEAQYRLGVMYEKNEGVDIDKEEALSWYRKAAEQGHAKAQYSLGCWYLNDAVLWYQLAANQGYQSAKEVLQQMSAAQLIGSENSEEEKPSQAERDSISIEMLHQIRQREERQKGNEPNKKRKLDEQQLDANDNNAVKNDLNNSQLRV